MEEKNWYDGVPAPFDADGNVVPLTTRKLYCGDGREVEVREVSLVDHELNGDWVWCVRTPDGAAQVLNLLHLERPDSWERLEADLMAMVREDSACYYFGAGADIDCTECPAENYAGSCRKEAFRDVFRRAWRLR